MVLGSDPPTSGYPARRADKKNGQFRLLAAAGHIVAHPLKAPADKSIHPSKTQSATGMVTDIAH